MANGGKAELFQIATADYLPRIYEELEREKQLTYRLMYVEALARVPSGFSQSRLAKTAVEDKDEQVRELAFTMLELEHFNRDQIARVLAGYFVSPDNVDVQRAGFIIGELGSDVVLPQMIKALNTRHTFNNPGGVQQGRTGSTFGSDGSAGLNLGGPPPTVERDVKNDEVRKALIRLTKQRHLDYNEANWQAWYVKNYTLYDYDFRYVK